MKYLLLVLCLCLAGCATTPVNEAAKVETAASVVNDAVPYIKAISQAAVHLSLQYAEKDDAKRGELTLQIHVVAVNLEDLLAKRDFSPEAVTSALKVKESYINSILEGVGVAYIAAYDKLAENGRIDFAIQILQALAEGVAQGTDVN